MEPYTLSADLYIKFAQNFWHDWLRQMKIGDLLNNKQNDVETNKKFITQFRGALKAMEDAHDIVIIKEFKKTI